MMLISSSCAVSYHMPNNRFETSELAGAYKNVKLYGGYGQGKDVELTQDFSQKWIDTENPVLRRTNFLTAGLDFGLSEKFDVGLQYVADLGIVLKGKMQIIGKKLEPGFQVAASIHAGGGSEKKKENNHTPTSAELDNSAVGADVIFGYRLNEKFLVYASSFYDSAHYEAVQTRSSTTREYKGNSSNYGATAGGTFFLNKEVEFIAEFARARAKSNSSRLTSSSYGAMVTIHL